MPDRINEDMPRFRVLPNMGVPNPTDLSDFETPEEVVKRVGYFVEDGADPQRIQVGEWNQQKGQYDEFVSLPEFLLSFVVFFALNQYKCR